MSTTIRRGSKRAVAGRPVDGRSSPRRPSGTLRVPAITAWFWIAKALSTALGESASDSLVRILGPVPAVLLGAATFVGALVLQLRVRRYRAVPYWLAVVMVGVFGTMAADVVHVGLGVPYVVSASLAAVALAVADWLDAEAASLDAMAVFTGVAATVEHEVDIRGAALTLRKDDKGAISLTADTSGPALAVARAFMKAER